MPFKNWVATYQIVILWMKPKKLNQKIKFSKPRQSWQVFDYDRRLNLQTILPYQFLLLCKLLNTTPADMITDFLDNLSHASWKRHGRDAAKQKLVEYILLCSYGTNYYSPEDIYQMFKELDSIGLLFPSNAETELLNKYVAFREPYQDYWFNQWYYKARRNEPLIKS